MHLVADLQCSANKLFFEIEMMNSNLPLFLMTYVLPSNVGYTDSSKWQSANVALNKSPILGFKYFTIERDSYPTYIPNVLLGPIFVRCGGAIGTYTTQSKVQKWKIFGSWPKTNSNGEMSW